MVMLIADRSLWGYYRRIAGLLQRLQFDELVFSLSGLPVIIRVMIQPSEPVEGPRAGVVGRDYPESFRSEGVEWLPRRAELRMRISGADPTVTWYECQLVLAAGPSSLYRYLPFECFVYVDNELEAIVEFEEASSTAVAYIRCPADREFTLSIVSEVGSAPRQTGDARELALIFDGFSVEEATVTPPRARLALQGAEDFYSQHRVRIVRALPQPVFVLGAYRSGTSVLTWALGQHPDIWPLDETNFLGLIGSGAVASFLNAASAPRNFFDIYDVSQQEYLAHLGETVDHFLRRASERRELQVTLETGGNRGVFRSSDSNFRLLRSAYSPKRRWVDGTPENTHHALLLRKLFPLAKFICVVRNPYDTVASLVHFRRIGGMSIGVDEAIEAWKELNTAALNAARAFGSDVVKVVSHDHIVAEPRKHLRQLFSFLGEPRYPAASTIYQQSINSSSVTDQERHEIKFYIDRLPGALSPMPLYDQLVELCDARWQPDPAVAQKLEESLADIVRRIGDQLR